MNEVWKVFLSMSCSGGLLILALLFGKGFLKDKISRQWQYYIWLIVVLRLLLPIGPEVNLLGNTYQAVDQALVQAGPPRSGGERDARAPAAGREQNQEPAGPPAEEATAAPPLQELGALLADHVWLVWLVIALGLLIRKVTIYQGFMRYLKAGLTPVSDLAALDRLSIAAERAGIQKPVELCVNPLISSPLLIGFFHPCIVLPDAGIAGTDFQYIVLHELTHYKRRDMFYKWLVQITVCLHWFNPLVHLMSREITRACEFSCDEAVLAKMGGENAEDYGKTLLDAMAAVGKYRENLGSVTLSENKQILKERLGAIMKFQKPSGAVKLLTAVLTVCIVLGASFVGVYTTGNAQAASLPGTALDTTGRPSLSLDVSSAAVNVLAAADNQISAEYNSDVYTVNISQQNHDWKISISCKTSTNTNDETIKLYLPNVDYGDVRLKADNGYLTCGLIQSGNILGNFNMASVFLSLPEGFSGSVNVTADSGYFQLVSQDDFKNTTVTITDNGDWGEIYKPKNFKENGNTSAFTDGTGANTIRVTRKGSGVMGIYTSQSFTASNEFPDDWKELWQDEWQGKPWEDDWWQNTWREDNSSEMETIELKGKTYYQVANEAQLRAIGTGNYGMDQNYMQQADIQLSPAEWTPIGTWEDPFTGTFNGNGFEIKGLTMTDPNAMIVGLFGVAENAHIYNVTLRDYDIASAGKNVSGKSVGAVLAIGQGSRSYDNFVYPKETSTNRESGVSQIERYYKAGSLPMFQITFPQLEEGEQLAWLEKIYADEAIAFFSVAVRGLDANSSVLTRFAEQVYKDADIAFFSTLADCMGETELELWLDRALEDGNWAFQSMLFDKLNRKDEFDGLEAKREKEWAEAQMAEYEKVGVTMADEKTYYYQGQLVNIFLDIRKEGSFYTLNMNPAGTVNIKITRDADNNITGAAYMTEAEVTELLEDMSDDDDSQKTAGGRIWHPKIIPVNYKTVAEGEIIWLGEYTLSEGDRIWYDVSAETGNGLQVGFAKPGDVDLNTTYYSAANLRQEGDTLNCTSSFTFRPPVKPGTYHLFLRATDGALGDVKGSISIGFAAEAS